MLTGIFDNLVFWHWWVFAIVLLILEIFTLGAFFMWMSAAAGVIGAILFVAPELNTREDELIGKVFEVKQAIVNGSGRVKVGESTWKANGPDCDIGTSVRVKGVNGAELTVELV